MSSDRSPQAEPAVAAPLQPHRQGRWPWLGLALLALLLTGFALGESRGWPWLVANALAGPSIGVSCFQWALMTEKTSIVLPIVATSPLLVIPLTRLVDGERITKRSVTGGLIAVAGVIGLTVVR